MAARFRRRRQFADGSTPFVLTDSDRYVGAGDTGHFMPPKVRKLISDLEHAGFENRGGKGSHKNFAHPRQPEQMNSSNRYAKVVEWSNEDECFVGSAPGLILGGCHGDDERKVYDELCVIVEEAIALYEADGKPLPPPTAGHGLVEALSALS